MDSKPMKWSELRERVAELVEIEVIVGRTWKAKALLDDIDAAAPAMEEQELLAAEARRRRAIERMLNGEL